MQKLLSSALIQMDIVWNDPQANLAKAETLLDRAAEAGVRLALLPEMFVCGFSFPSGDTAREMFASGYECLLAQAAKNGLYCGGSLPFVPDGEELAYNLFVMCGPEGEVARYAKIHLFSYGGEDKKALRGRELCTFSIDGVRCTPFICYDLRFPARFAERAEQTDLFIVAANWPAVRRSHWDVLLRARAIENQAYVLGVNRIGEGGGIDYDGGTRAYSPKGELIAADSGGEELVLAEIDPEEVRKYREEFPALDDRP